MIIAFLRYLAPIMALMIPVIVRTLAGLNKKMGPKIAIMVLVAIGIRAIAFNPDFPITNDSPHFYESAQRIGPSIPADETIVIAYQQNGFLQGRWMAMELAHLPGLFPRDAVIIDRPMSETLKNEIRTDEAQLICVTMQTDLEAIPLLDTRVNDIED